MFQLRVRWAILLLVASLSAGAWAQSDVASVLRRADADARSGRYDAARESYTDAIRRGASLDQDAARCELLALSYANSNASDLASAIRWFQNALRLSGDERVRAELADTLVRADRYEEAAEHYQALVKAHPASTVYMIALSRALLQAGRAEEALQALQTWLGNTPGATAVRLEYARILSYQKHFSDARQQYETVIKNEPANLVAQIGVAKVTSWQGDQETALALYNRILERSPSNYDALVGKAFSLLWMGRQTEALPLLEASARRNPNDGDVREALGRLRGAANPSETIAAAPPSLPEVPAAAPAVRGEARPPISVPPPTRLPEVTAAQRSAGERAFAPKNSAPMPSASGQRTAAQKPERAADRRKAATSQKSAGKDSEPEPDPAEAKPETNVFGFTGMSNARIAVILSIVVGVLLILLVTMTSRDRPVEDRHEMPRAQGTVVKVSRSYNTDEPAKPAAQAASVVPEPVTTPVRRKELDERNLAGIPRRSYEERIERPSPRPEPPIRRSPPPRPPVQSFPTQMLPRVKGALQSEVRLDGLRVLLVGAEDQLVDFERFALQSAGAEVLIEANWTKAVDRMTSAGIHCIVLNEGGGDQTRRIYDAVANQYPGWLRRMLLVLAEDNGPTRLFISTCQAKCLIQPFQSDELLARLGAMFGRAPQPAQ